MLSLNLCTCQLKFTSEPVLRNGTDGAHGNFVAAPWSKVSPSVNDGTTALSDSTFPLLHSSLVLNGDLAQKFVFTKHAEKFPCQCSMFTFKVLSSDSTHSALNRLVFKSYRCFFSCLEGDERCVCQESTNTRPSSPFCSIPSYPSLTQWLQNSLPNEGNLPLKKLNHLDLRPRVTIAKGKIARYNYLNYAHQLSGDAIGLHSRVFIVTHRSEW